MYRVNKRIHKHRRARNTTIIMVTICLIAVVVYGLMHLRVTPEQNLRNTAPISKKYDAAVDTKLVVDKPLFSMELPGAWKEIPTVKTPSAPLYSFRSPSGQAQLLDMYIDNTPSGMALNRAIVVNGLGDGVEHDAVSENCTTYTDASKVNPQNKYAPARWQTTDFICDMGNYQRALVGTVSNTGINQVSVSGPTVGAHKLFITYTDNNINPNYTVFYNILDSLRFK